MVVFPSSLRKSEPCIEELEACDWYASDNGFSSRVAMDRAHQPIVRLAVETLGPAGGAVLDLGCGNGALLRKIRLAVLGVVPYGIEYEPERCEHAKALNGEFSHHFRVGDMFDPDVAFGDRGRYDLALLMPGRLLEVEHERAAPLRRAIAERCDRLLVYAYGDWLTRFGNLAGLAREARISVTDASNDTTAALARIR